MKAEEKMFNPREQIPNTGERAHSVIYVARGTVLEQDGGFDDLFTRSLRYKRGRIACLQNLLPNVEKLDLQSDLYCHGAMMASVEYLDLSALREILANDHVKLCKLWKILASRLSVIHHDKLP